MLECIHVPYTHVSINFFYFLINFTTFIRVSPEISVVKN